MAYQYPLNGGRINATIGGNTAGAGSLVSTGTLTLVGGNNITLSQNGNAITIAGSNGGGGSINFSAGTTSNNLASVTFADSNGINFGLNAGTLTASHNALTSQSNQVFSASGGSSAFQTLSFSNGGGVTFTNTNGQVGASVQTNYAATNITSNNMQTTERGNYFYTSNNTFANQTHSHGNPTLNLTNISGTTASASNGFTLSLSAANPGAGGGGPAISAAGGLVTNNTVSFANSNRVSFGMNASTLTASIDLINMGMSTQGNTSGNTGLVEGGQYLFVGGNNITLSQATAAGNNATLSISAPAMSSLVGVGGITLSTNGNTISISGGGGGGAAAVGSYFDNMFQQASQPGLQFTTLSAMSHRMLIQPLSPGNELFPYNITAGTLRLNFSNSVSSAQSASVSGGFSSTFYIGIYTRSNSTQLSLLNSGSQSYGAGANASNTSLMHGARWLTFGSAQFSTNLSFQEGVRYFFGLIARTSGTNPNNLSIAGMHLGASIQRSGLLGASAVSNTSLNAWHPFMGVYGTTITALPVSIANSQINKASNYANFIPQIILDAGLGHIE